MNSKLTIENLPALILIDFQKAFENEEYWGGTRNNPDAEKNALKLLNFWRRNKLPLFHIKHISINPDAKHGINNLGHHFMDQFEPLDGEITIVKSVNSAFIGTDLKQQLDGKNLTTLVIIGLTTDHCVSTTTRMAGNYGYHTFLVSDATATFGKKGINSEYYDGETMHHTALAQLNHEFATIMPTQDMMQLLDKTILLQS